MRTLLLAMLVSIYAACTALTAAAQPAAGQAVPPLVQQFRASNRNERIEIISEVLLGKRSATVDDTHTLLAAAMIDPDPMVRREAVGSVAAIWILTSMPAIPAGQEWAVRLKPVAAALRNAVEAAVADDDLAVRLEALRGIVAQFAYVNPHLPLPVTKILAARYETDSNPLIRIFTMSVLARTRNSDDAEARQLARQLLLRALEDREPDVVAAAGISAGSDKLPEALPLLLKQLKNPSSNARMSVSQGIAGYGATARPYLVQLEQALELESDDITRKTLEGTIATIRRAP
jgi:HEAT repeat protein